MRTISFFLVFCFCCTMGCQKTDSFQYKQSMISSGNNFPDFNFNQNHLDRLIVSLHEKTSREEFIKKYNWNIESYNSAISFLETKGFVKKINNSFVPTCMIISKKDGEELFKNAELISKQIADSITVRIPKLKEKYLLTHLSKTVPFDTISFFIISNVLLDNWQIGNVEYDFLHSERPSRHGKNYYYSFFESSFLNSDPFGIYGNMGFKIFSVFGNNQRKVNSLKIAQNLESIPLVDSLDNSIFEEFSNEFKGPLISILNDNKEYAVEIYNKTGYSKEVDFPEFFIWWYHFIYTQTTNLISKKGIIFIPKNGNFYYRIK